ncbi:MAG: tRNA (cytidine(34)-2'-O)-methyltransferase [Candidatus Hydrogenedentota bacterium]
MISIALIEPEIPQNTGNVARLSVALGVELILVGPLGYTLDDRRVRRSGMDYWKQVRLRTIPNYASFLEEYRGRRLVGVDPRGHLSYRDFSYQDGDILLFGSESVGLREVPETSVRIPMAPGCRSINLSNAVAIVAYEAMKGSL